MITNLSTFLAIEYLKRLTSEQVPWYETDPELQLFEVALSGGGEERRRDPEAREIREAREDLSLLRGYLRLGITDLEGIPPQAHIWFLERLCLDPEAMRESDATVLRNVYFLSPHDVRRYLVVSALLGLGNRWETNRDLVEVITEAIREDGALSKPEKAAEVQELTEILLDLFSTENPAARRALASLAAAEQEGFLREEHPVASTIYSRAELLGGEDGELLRRVLDRPHPRER